MLLGENASNEANNGPVRSGNTDDVCAAPDLFIEPFLRVIAPRSQAASYDAGGRLHNRRADRSHRVTQWLAPG